MIDCSLEQTLEVNSNYIGKIPPEFLNLSCCVYLKKRDDSINMHAKLSERQIKVYLFPFFSLKYPHI